MTDKDQLLDEITEYLRTQPVPEMPYTLPPSRSSRRRRWLGPAMAAAALAASLVGLLLWALSGAPDDPRVPRVAQGPDSAPRVSEVVVLDVDLVEPLSKVEADLEDMAQELASLRRSAALLDARRKADELLAKY